MWNKNVGGVKLPKINLLHFNGEITKFNAFWQSFECAIHRNSSVPAVNKLTIFYHYLNDQRTGHSKDYRYKQKIMRLLSKF